MMISSSMFFGHLISPELEKKLDLIPSAILNYYVKEKPSDYLEKIKIKESFYIGKTLELPLDIAELETMQMHIFSLIRCFLDQEECKKIELSLYAISSISS